MIAGVRRALHMLQGIAFPAVHSIISVSVPKGYQSTAVAVVTAASYAGVAVAAGAAPWIIEEYSWPFVFYVFGLSAVLWLPFWLQATVPSGHVLPDSTDAVSLSARNDVESLDSPGGLARGGPTQNEPQANAAAGASSTQEEEDALLDASGQVAAEAKVLGSAFGLDRAFWGLVRRKPVWAICVTQYCQSWGMYALFNWLPTFFNEQVRLDLPASASATKPTAVHRPDRLGTPASCSAQSPLVQGGWLATSIDRLCSMAWM